MTVPVNSKRYRASQVKLLTNKIGVYALCDLDGVPIYVGQSVDGIRARVQRHLTSARSDIIANCQIDVWEIAYVWAWPAQTAIDIPHLEAKLFNLFDSQMSLMNGKIMRLPKIDVDVPERESVQVIEDAERLKRLDPALRLPRQISQYHKLVDYIQTVKDEPHLKRSLAAHFDRLVKYHNTFLS